jgi:hypothetical protein
MGTRNLTVVRDSKGTAKIALYGQWDGYPSYSGITALAFLRDKANQEMLRNKLTLVEFVDDQEANAIYESLDNESFLNEYPGLHRDTGVKILEAVASANATVKTVDNTEFANDKLFCEGIYEVDFSTNKFISIYDDKVVEYDLDNLPIDKDYLSAFEVEQFV